MCIFPPNIAFPVPALDLPRWRSYYGPACVHSLTSHPVCTQEHSADVYQQLRAEHRSDKALQAALLRRAREAPVPCPTCRAVIDTTELEREDAASRLRLAAASVIVHGDGRVEREARKKWESWTTLPCRATSRLSRNFRSFLYLLLPSLFFFLLLAASSSCWPLSISSDFSFVLLLASVFFFLLTSFFLLSSPPSPLALAFLLFLLLLFPFLFLFLTLPFLFLSSSFPSHFPLSLFIPPPSLFLSFPFPFPSHSPSSLHLPSFSSCPPPSAGHCYHVLACGLLQTFSPTLSALQRTQQEQRRRLFDEQLRRGGIISAFVSEPGDDVLRLTPAAV